MPTEPAASNAAKVAWVLLVNTTSGGWPTGAGMAARWTRASQPSSQPAIASTDRPSHARVVTASSLPAVRSIPTTS